MGITPRDPATAGTQPVPDTTEPLPLLQDGPTVEAYVTAGFKAETYPPTGFASKSTDEEIAAAIAAQNAPPEAQTAQAPEPATVPPANEFPPENPAETPAEAPAPAVEMASMGNPGENARLKDIKLSDLPVITDPLEVNALAEGALFLAEFICAPNSDKAWHATQIIENLKSGRNIINGLSQAYWSFHYRNRPPIGEKRGKSYVMID